MTNIVFVIINFYDTVKKSLEMLENEVRAQIMYEM